jgi:uncharacterized protein YaaR (DUF327 family)
MKKQNKYYIIIIVFILGVGLLNKYYINKRNMNTESKIDIIIKNHIAGVVDSVHSSKGFLDIRIKKNKKVYLIPPSRNYNYVYPNISDVLSKGDSLFKKNDCDTLKIIKNLVDEYIFVIREDINKK